VLDGEAWKADFDCRLSHPPRSALTPYAVVAPFSPAEPIELPPVLTATQLEPWLRRARRVAERPDAIRIDGRFAGVQLRSVPKQRRPYPPLAEAIAHQHVVELKDVAGTMVGFRFPDALDGIEMAGFHLHFVTDDRLRGGHVLGYTALEGTVALDEAAELHVELPPAVAQPAHGTTFDPQEIARLEGPG
jgi:acetolactate decarboxylase